MDEASCPALYDCMSPNVRNVRQHTLTHSYTRAHTFVRLHTGSNVSDAGVFTNTGTYSVPYLCINKVLHMTRACIGVRMSVEGGVRIGSVVCTYVYGRV